MLFSTATQEDPSSLAVATPTTPSPPHPPPSNSTATCDDKRSSTGKKATRQWEAWTHEEEENFFAALRHVGKNFDKITSRVQSKNKDQVRHYYYRLIRRINKILAPGFSLDAKNTKDANSAMLRWWSLLEKQSCSASKLHLKPRRFKTFVTALEHQLLKDRVKASKKKTSQPVCVVAASASRKTAAGVPEVAKPVIAEDSSGSKVLSGKGSSRAVIIEDSCGSKSTFGKSGSIRQRSNKKQDPSHHSKKRKKGSDSTVSAAAIKRWERAATAGVSLVAEAAEQVERAAAAQLRQAAPSVYGQDPQPEGLAVSGNVAMQGADVAEAIMEDGKLRLQLYPIDEATQKSMEQDGVNPYLQLTLKPRKPVPSVVRHLIQKWGGTSAAIGKLSLFPFTAHLGSINTGWSWSLDNANVNMGDVYAALGKPSVFRLRYGWLPPQLGLPSCLTAEAGLQASPISRGMNAAVQSSTHAVTPLIHQSSASLDCAKLGNLFQSGDALSCTPNCPDAAHAQDGELNCAKSQQVEAGKWQYSGGMLSAMTMPCARHNQADAILKGSGLVSSSVPEKHARGVIHGMDARESMSNFCEASADYEAANMDKAVQEGARNGVSPAACSWLYEGSNDSFIQRIWAVEVPDNPVSSLPNELDWADTLTNISLSEVLGDASQGGLLTHTGGAASIEALRATLSLDSFDAAVAAQRANAPGQAEASHVQQPTEETPAWDSEETRDAFTFRKVVAQRQTSNSGQSGSAVLPVFGDSPKEPDAVTISLQDCGSLEAWKQSFSLGELSYPEEWKCDAASRLFAQQSGYSQDFAWVIASGALSTGIGAALGNSRDEHLWSKDKLVGSTAAVDVVCSSEHGNGGLELETK